MSSLSRITLAFALLASTSTFAMEAGNEPIEKELPVSSFIFVDRDSGGAPGETTQVFFGDRQPSTLLHSLAIQSKEISSHVDQLLNIGSTNLAAIKVSVAGLKRSYKELKKELFPNWESKNLATYLYYAGHLLSKDGANLPAKFLIETLPSEEVRQGLTKLLKNQENKKAVENFLSLGDCYKEAKEDLTDHQKELDYLHEALHFYENLPNVTQELLNFINYHPDYCRLTEGGSYLEMAASYQIKTPLKNVIGEVESNKIEALFKQTSGSIYSDTTFLPKPSNYDSVKIARLLGAPLKMALKESTVSIWEKLLTDYKSNMLKALPVIAPAATTNPEEIFSGLIQFVREIYSEETIYELDPPHTGYDWVKNRYKKNKAKELGALSQTFFKILTTFYNERMAHKEPLTPDGETIPPLLEN